jgi:hypothetical protein
VPGRYKEFSGKITGLFLAGWRNSKKAAGRWTYRRVIILNFSTAPAGGAELILKSSGPSENMPNISSFRMKLK